MTGGSTGITMKSSHLAARRGHHRDLTTSENSTLTESGNAAGSEIQTGSQSQGTLGILSSGGSSDSPRLATTDTHSSPRSIGVTVLRKRYRHVIRRRRDDVRDDSRGVDRFQPFTLAGSSTETQMTTDTVALGTDGVVASGGDTLWDTVTDSGSQTLYSLGSRLFPPPPPSPLAGGADRQRPA